MAADDLAAAHARLLRDPRIQFDFPRYVPPPAHPPPHWLTAFLRWLAGLGGGDRPHGASVQLDGWAAWTGFGLLVALALAAVAFDLLRRRARTPAPAPVDLDGSDLRPVRARALALLADCDALAAQTRYGEAARLLLQRCLLDIEERRPGTLRPAWTAREVAGWSALPGPVRADLLPIVAQAERHSFAAAPVAATDWGACRSAYERFAFPQAWEDAPAPARVPA